MKKLITNKFTARILIFLVFFSMSTLSFRSCHALSVVEGISCAGTGKNVPTCTISEFLEIAVNVSKIILGSVGILSLLAFIYGGFMFLISGGSSERVTKAKQIILSAVLGLTIVFTSYMIINFVLEAMGYMVVWNVFT